jgi:hypothetical protein
VTFSLEHDDQLCVTIVWVIDERNLERQTTYTISVVVRIDYL